MSKSTLLFIAWIAGVLVEAEMASNLQTLCMVLCLVCGGAGLARPR